MNPPSAPATVIEALAASLEAASAGNPNDAEPPAAVLWTDRDSRWRPIVPRLRALIPQLLALGEYDPEERTGPAIWLRCVIDRTLEAPGFPPDTTPIVYLPGAGRQELGVADACPDHLKPLVELQYRGACWTQRNGRDWTVEAFLTSRDGDGLGLDLARDAATRQSMQRALTALAAISVQALRGRRLEAEDFDRLFSDDPVRDVLVWLSDAEAARAGWEAGRWSAFASRCKTDLGFDPEKDGGIVAAERLGRREGPWGSVWRRFAEAPALYPGVPELLRKAMPDAQRDDLFAEPSSWPQNNERDEAALRRALLNLENEAPAAAREQVAVLEKAHGARRGWVWAKLDRAPLAHALASLASLAARASKELGGASVAEMAKLYAGGAWEIDAAALDGMAAVKSSADAQAVGAALNAIYRPWLESAARRLQALAEAEPLPGSDAGGTRRPQDAPSPGRLFRPCGSTDRLSNPEGSRDGAERGSPAGVGPCRLRSRVPYPAPRSCSEPCFGSSSCVSSCRTRCSRVSSFSRVRVSTALCTSNSSLSTSSIRAIPAAMIARMLRVTSSRTSSSPGGRLAWTRRARSSNLRGSIISVTSDCAPVADPDRKAMLFRERMPAYNLHSPVPEPFQPLDPRGFVHSRIHGTWRPDPHRRGA